MNLKTDLTYLSILIGLVIVSNRVVYARIETSAIITTDANRNTKMDIIKLHLENAGQYDFCFGLTAKQTLQKFHSEILNKKMGIKESGENFNADILVRNDVNENKTYLNYASRVLPGLSYEHFALNHDPGDHVNTKEFYLHRAKNQNTAAWILLTGGTVMAVVGMIGFDQNFDIGPINLFGPPDPVNQSKNDNASAADIYGFIAIAGIVADLVSIPFFISAHHNKKMASLISFGNQNINAPFRNSFSKNSYSTLTLKVDF